MFVSVTDANKTVPNDSTINHVYNDKKISIYSQLCLNCGITLNESMKRIDLCKATKSFTCSACSFKCCNKNNLECHMQNDHKISSNYDVTSNSKEKEITEAMNNSSKKRYRKRVLKSQLNIYYYFFFLLFFLSLITFMTYFLVDRKRDIEVYCDKCTNTSRSSTNDIRETCELCNAYVIYQCRICKKHYTDLSLIYRHLRNECINIEPPFKCNQCDYKTKRKVDLKRHVQIMHSIKKCRQCDKIFKDYFALRVHQRSECINEAMLKCNYCSYKTIFKTPLMKHIRFEHNSRYMCSQCGKKYINWKHFENHQKNGCGSELHFECIHCSYNTNHKPNLRRHIRSQHSEIFSFGDSL